MGASFYAHAVIGIRVNGSRLYREPVKTPGCQHDNDLDAKFCSECGKPTWGSVRGPIAGYDPEGSKVSDYCPTFAGFKVLKCSDNSERPYVVIAVQSATARCYEGHSPTLEPLLPRSVLDEKRDRLKAALEPLGLWDEAMFGLWAVLYVSA